MALGASVGDTSSTTTAGALRARVTPWSSRRTHAKGAASHVSSALITPQEHSSLMARTNWLSPSFALILPTFPKCALQGSQVGLRETGARTCRRLPAHRLIRPELSTTRCRHGWPRAPARPRQCGGRSRRPPSPSTGNLTPTPGRRAPSFRQFRTRRPPGSREK